MRYEKSRKFQIITKKSLFFNLGSWLLVLGSWFFIPDSIQSFFLIILLTLKSKNTEINESKTTTYTSVS